ncbi:MAG: hypothetical protein R3242_08590 [Akkermansiaceae bacterium]|nr:hypothetical protein [Akkermansiaceae bacterium]
MKDKPHEIESQLRDQQAAQLDPALLDRLEAALEGELTQLSKAELAFEAELRAIRPDPMGPDLLRSLEAEVEGLPAPTQVNVLPFPGPKETSSQRSERKPISGLAVAAAVALLGALTAILFDPAPTGQVTAGQQPPTGQQAPADSPLPEVVPAEAVTPAKFSRDLNETLHQGYIWPANEEPHRVLKVTYTDRLSVQGEDGVTVEVEQPKVEYYLLPTESH